MSTICLVGAGNIARTHAEILRAMPGHSVTAVVDPNLDAATRMAEGLGARPFTSLEDALADPGLFTRAHVLTPPDMHHGGALQLLQAGKAVLVEKPLAVTGTECAALLDAAAGTALGVNQNFVHHPAFRRLRAMVGRGTFGRVSWVGCTYNVPLRQLGTKQFGHWMFQAPGNIVLEQAVHPLSQLVALAGPVHTLRALPGAAQDIAPGVPFVATIDVVMHGRLPAQLRFAVGQNYPFWQVTAVCDDGVIVADILANRVFTYGRNRWLPQVDDALAGLRTAGALARDSVGGLASYARSIAKLRPRNDPFFQSMQGSIAAFHDAVDAGRVPELDGAFCAHLVGLCEQLRDQALPVVAAPIPVTAPVTAPVQATGSGQPWDVAVLGGTGFIGSYVVRRFLNAGLRVGVLARNGRNLPAVFQDPRVTFIRGSIGNTADVEKAIGSAKLVVNLAHGGGGATFEAIRDAMVGGAETVAQACLRLGVTRLVHVGSIASLYLGPQPGAIDGRTPPDPQEEKRGDYARAKVLADRALLALHGSAGLPVVILRPGVVVGGGGLPFQSGVGLYNNDQHAIGWNAGTNPRPCVLAEDVADAGSRATQATGIEGHAYNVVGDVRMTAREYTAALGEALGRPLRFHPQSARFLWAEDTGKWLVKRATGRAVPAPALRDFLSRGMMAAFDTSDVKRDLGWTPVADRAVFLERGVHIHA